VTPAFPGLNIYKLFQVINWDLVEAVNKFNTINYGGAKFDYSCQMGVKYDIYIIYIIISNIYKNRIDSISPKRGD
jgi:hypothetical protein